mmetsp:Transcript_4810/g.8559  ORF Transcript_4810/g.8559 Transcript_4810/m.8559 type:complete len:274 (-) Transcript_4810:83-904(-)
MFGHRARIFLLVLFSLFIQLKAEDGSEVCDENAILSIIKDYAPACIAACPSVCSPLQTLIITVLMGGDPVPIVCAQEEIFKCMVVEENLDTCTPLLDAAKDYAEIEIPRSTAELSDQCQTSTATSTGTMTWTATATTTATATATFSSAAPTTTASSTWTTTSVVHSTGPNASTELAANESNDTVEERSAVSSENASGFPMGKPIFGITHVERNATKAVIVEEIDPIASTSIPDTWRSTSSFQETGFVHSSRGHSASFSAACAVCLAALWRQVE